MLLTMSIRLILIGSRSGESINKLISVCLLIVSGITLTLTLYLLCVKRVIGRIPTWQKQKKVHDNCLG